MLKRALMLFAGILLLSQTGLVAQDPMAEAMGLYGQEKYDEATQTLQSFLTTKPKNADEVHYWLGMIKYRQEAFELAKKKFEESVAAKAKSAYGHAGLGLMLMIEQNYTEANSHLLEANEYAKGRIPEVVFTMAEAYLKGGKPEIEQAKVLLYNYRTLDPEEPRTYIMLGEYYKVGGVPELAMAELEKAIEKAPSYVPAYTGLAELYYERGKETKSGEDYQKGYQMVTKALELNPNFAPAYRIRAELFLISKDPNRFERARADIEKYLELAGDDLKAKVRYIQFIFLTEDYQLVLDEMSKIDTVTNVLRRLKGRSLAELGRYAEAKTAMDEYFAATKEQYHLASDYEVYGDILRKSGDRTGADQYYQKAMSMKPVDYKDFYDGLAEGYKAEAKAIEAQAAEIRKQAKELEGAAMIAYNGANDCAAAGNAVCRDSLKAVMDKAVADREGLLAQADQVAAGTAKIYEQEAYYRQMALTFADPVTLTQYKDMGIAYYNAAMWTEAEAAFKKMSELKADYMLPYTYRFRIAYELEKVDPSVNNWIAKPVSDDVIAAFSANPTGTGLSTADMRSLLLSYEVQALYAFDPEGDNADYNCSGARPWIDKIIAIDAAYERIVPVKSYCDEVQK